MKSPLPGAHSRTWRFARKTRRLVATLGACALGLSLSAVSAGPAAAATSSAAASSGASVLMQSYQSGTGLIGTGGWWQSAVALSTVMTYQHTTGDTTYNYAISAAFNDNKSGNFENAYMDDTGWWALVWIQAYDLTGNTAYLQMAETDANYIHGYWDTTCGGGVWWSTAKTYKNAIANELFLQVTAELHNRVAGDTTYLGWANAEWNWFNGSGMINSSHLINDGLTSSCTNNGETVWSYNQGVVLAGLSDLEKATGNTSLFTSAETIASAAVSHLAPNGVLADTCEPNCGADGSSFKGIFVRDLEALATGANVTTYNSFLLNQASSIEAKDTNSSGQLGLVWAGPVEDLSSAAQASAEDALVAALATGGTVPPPPPPPAAVPVSSGISGKCLDDSNNVSTDGTKVDLWDCNGSSAQKWTYTNSTLQVNGKCLDVTGASTADGALTELWDCNGGANQVWNSVNNTLVNPASGKCLDDPASSATNGTQQDIWDCNGGGNQKWTLGAVAPTSQVGPVDSGVSGKCLDDSNNVSTDGTKVDLWDCNGSSAQKWTYTNSTLQVNGKCLDITGASTADGALTELWDCNGGANQKWNSVNNTLVNPASGKCLDDPGYSSTNGTQIDIWDCNSGTNQKWTLTTS